MLKLNVQQFNYFLNCSFCIAGCSQNRAPTWGMAGFDLPFDAMSLICFWSWCLRNRASTQKHISGIAAICKSRPAIPQADARFRKHLHRKRISGIAANSKSKPAIPQVDARFRRHAHKTHISDIAANSKSTPAIPHVDARFRKLSRAVYAKCTSHHTFLDLCQALEPAISLRGRCLRSYSV